MGTEQDGVHKGRISRRDLLKRGGVGAAVLLVPGVLEACGTSTTTTTTSGAATTLGTTATTAATTTTTPIAGTLKIGFVSPRTGPAAAFGDPDPYVIDLARKSLASGSEHRRQAVRRRDPGP